MVQKLSGAEVKAIREFEASDRRGLPSGLQNR